MDLKDIKNLIKFVSKSGTSKVKLKIKDIKITIKTYNKTKTTTPNKEAIQTTQGNNISQKTTNEEIPEITTQNISSEPEQESKYLTIVSPIIGTFYRRPSPDKEMFVEVGDMVNENSIVCVIEAMKLFNEIESEVSGKIVKILVEDVSPVEFGQPLFLVDPF